MWVIRHKLKGNDHNLISANESQIVRFVNHSSPDFNLLKVYYIMKVQLLSVHVRDSRNMYCI